VPDVFGRIRAGSRFDRRGKKTKSAACVETPSIGINVIYHLGFLRAGAAKGVSTRSRIANRRQVGLDGRTGRGAVVSTLTETDVWSLLTLLIRGIDFFRIYGNMFGGHAAADRSAGLVLLPYLLERHGRRSLPRFYPHNLLRFQENVPRLTDFRLALVSSGFQWRTRRTDMNASTVALRAL